MKKFSTAVLLTVLLTGFLPLHAAWSAGVCEWAANAPDKHLVRTGDTLWDIASLFLNNPWCWQEVWKPNQSLITNPHWIYPGQIIVLNRLNNSLSLEDGNPDSLTPKQLGPTIRSAPIDHSPLPLLSEKLQSLFARTPLIGTDALPNAPTVREIESGRVIAGKGDSVFVVGDVGPYKVFDVFRVQHFIVDPDTKQPLGVAGLSKEDCMIHLLNFVWPNIFETSPHVIAAVFEAIGGLRMALGPTLILQYCLQVRNFLHPVS